MAEMAERRLRLKWQRTWEDQPQDFAAFDVSEADTKIGACEALEAAYFRSLDAQKARPA